MVLANSSNNGASDAVGRLTGLEYRLLIEHSPVMIWRADLNKKCDYFNPVWLEFSGRALAEEVGDGWAEGVHPEDLDRCFQIYVSHFDQRLPFEMEYRLRRHDGVYRWIFDRGVPYTDDQGQFLGYIGSCVDVTDRREAEERRRALAAEHAAHTAAETKNAELQQTNARLQQAIAEAEQARAVTEEAYRELDQFAYAASHDLRAPLRGVSNLAQWIQEDAGEQLPERSAEHLHLLQGRIRRMEALIDGILAYSRAGRQLSSPQAVDTGELAREVTELLAPPEGAVVQIPQRMPVVEAERTPLQQVFLNLIGNGLKYSGAIRPDVRVCLAYRDTGDHYEFSVSDNGPGIAPEHHERIWEMFQTLEAQEKVEGTGIGLSVVKKVVEARGGGVSVESMPGAGATFRFTWRKRLPERALTERASAESASL